MNRFFLQPEYFSEEAVTFPPEIAHQILNVLRLGDGDLVEVLDNTGRAFEVRIMLDTAMKRVRGEIIQSYLVQTEPDVEVSLFFGLTSRDKVEWILQKGTEIGVAAFHPFISSRTLVQALRMTDKKTLRWNRIIREAAEQSRRGRLPLLHAAKPFDVCLIDEGHEHVPSLIAWEDDDSERVPLAQALKGFGGSKIRLFTGPEGGFSGDEINLAREAGCQIVSLGPRTLRMETAAILLPAVVLFELGAL